MTVEREMTVDGKGDDPFWTLSRSW